jgi:hypothetical protein
MTRKITQSVDISNCTSPSLNVATWRELCGQIALSFHFSSTQLWWIWGKEKCLLVESDLRCGVFDAALANGIVHTKQEASALLGIPATDELIVILWIGLDCSD